MFQTVEGRILLTADNQTGGAFDDIQEELDKLGDRGRTAGASVDQFGAKLMGFLTAGFQMMKKLNEADFANFAVWDEYSDRVELLRKKIQNMHKDHMVSVDQMQKFAAEKSKQVIGGQAEAVRVQEIFLRSTTRNNAELEKNAQLAADYAAYTHQSWEEGARSLERGFKSARGLQMLLKGLNIELRPTELARLRKDQERFSSTEFRDRAQRLFEQKSKERLEGLAAAANAANLAEEGYNDALEARTMRMGKAAERGLEKQLNAETAALNVQNKALQDQWDILSRVPEIAGAGALVGGVIGGIAGSVVPGLGTLAGAATGATIGAGGAISAGELYKMWMSFQDPETRKQTKDSFTGGLKTMGGPAGGLGALLEMLDALTASGGEQHTELQKSNEQLIKFRQNLASINDALSGKGGVQPTGYKPAGGRNPLLQDASFRFGGDLTAIRPGSYDPRSPRGGRGSDLGGLPGGRFGGDLNAIKPGSYDPRGARGGLNLDLGGLPGGRFGGGGFGGGGALGAGVSGRGGGGGGSRGGRASGGGSGPAAWAGGTAKPGQQAEALAQAELMSGMSELDPQGRATIMQYLKSGGVGMDPAQLPWCAAFVNASLNRAGIKGTGSNVATSFGAWGEAVKGTAQKGDVLVEMRGLSPGMSGGHVGFATGKTRTVNGELQYEMFGGNQGDMARNKWISASKVMARRAPISAGGNTNAVAGAGSGPVSTSGPAPASIAPENYFKGRNIAGLPAGMRVNNPGNIKYSGSEYQRSAFTGLMGPGSTRDQGDPQALFSSPTAGMMSAITLARRKYSQGLNTVNKLITDPKLGWTPGNFGSAKHIADTMGIDPDAPLNLEDPQAMDKFMHALVLQEHGKAGKLYGEEIYKEAIARSYNIKQKAVAEAAKVSDVTKDKQSGTYDPLASYKSTQRIYEDAYQNLKPPAPVKPPVKVSGEPSRKDKRPTPIKVSGDVPTQGVRPALAEKTVPKPPTPVKVSGDIPTQGVRPSLSERTIVEAAKVRNITKNKRPTSLKVSGDITTQGVRPTPAQIATDPNQSTSIQTDPTRPTPIEVANAKDKKVRIARSRVDVNLKLAKDLSMSKPTFDRDPDMDVGVMVDRTGTSFARPGDPSYSGYARI